jgi:hypothetical protein
MFDSILTAILSKFLGAYVDGLDDMNFSMSLGKVCITSTHPSTTPLNHPLIGITQPILDDDLVLILSCYHSLL